MDSASDAEVAQALSRLLPDYERGSDVIGDLCAAARVALQRRVDNSRDGGIVIAALRANGLTWQQIAARTGIPTRTARRWATPPPVNETDQGGAP